MKLVENQKGDNMTIKEAAAQHGVSTQAIYKRLNQHGVKLSTLKDHDTGELTADGEAVINQLFNQPKPTGNNQLKETISRMTTEIAEVKVQNEALRERVRELEADKAYLQGQNTELLTRIPPALPAPGQTEKRGFFSKLFGK